MENLFCYFFYHFKMQQWRFAKLCKWICVQTLGLLRKIGLDYFMDAKTYSAIFRRVFKSFMTELLMTKEEDHKF